MVQVVLIVGVLLCAAVAGVLLRRPRRPAYSPYSVAVMQQHIYLFQGGRLSESELESAKAAFRRLLDRGEAGRIEAGFQAGTRFAVAVRPPGRDRHRRGRQHPRTTIEATFQPGPRRAILVPARSGPRLARLSRPESLPVLLQSFPTEEAPLRHYLAAEMVCFPGFDHYLAEPETAAGQAALRVLHQALLGLRSGVQPHVVIQGRLGEAIELVWEQRHRVIDPIRVPRARRSRPPRSPGRPRPAGLPREPPGSATHSKNKFV